MLQVNKLASLFLAGLYNLVQYLRVWPGAYRGGGALFLTPKYSIRPKSPAGANALAYLPAMTKITLLHRWPSML